MPFSKKRIDQLFIVDLTKFYLVEKRDASICCLYAGFLFAYLGSLHPWFMWPLKELYTIPAAALIAISYLISNSMKEDMFSRKEYLSALFAYIILSYYIILVGDQNFNAYITNIFSVIIFFLLLKANASILLQITTFISKSIALILIPSIFFFLLYLIGFSLPHSNAVFGDNDYSYVNYYFFMIDDRVLSSLFPRFQSVFLEPGHLGSATSLLLMTQFGHWKKWWNVVLIIATIISFSLAAYAIMIALVFLSLWVQRKNLMGKLILTLTILAMIVAGALLYNNGSNMLNNLILARLEIDDKTGEIVGNNRVDKDFEKEFDKYMVSSDVFFGRDMSKIPRGSGNSGYRVFIYQNGLVGLVLLVLFYSMSFKDYRDYRYLHCAICISLLIFWIRGYPLWFSNFIPLLSTVFQVNNSSPKTAYSQT